MKQRILETAGRLFHLQGIQAVGVDTIAAEIGISTCAYNHSRPRISLLRPINGRFSAISPSDRPPAEQILRLFRRLERGFAYKDACGCLLIKAVTEVGATDPQVRKISKAFKESRRQWFLDQVTRLCVPNPELSAT